MSTILTILNNCIAFIIILSVVVFIHEFGHYIIAIINGVKVDEFAIGYGKELWGKVDKRGTKWKICALPFGGFVKFFGDEDASSSLTDREKLEKMSPENKEKCLYFKNVYQRIAIVFAGPLFNYILAFVLFTVFFAVNGINEFSNKITFIAENSPAQLADLQVGDKIISIDGDEIKNFEEIQLKVNLSAGETINLVIDRNSEKINKTLTPEITEKTDINGNTIKTLMIGIGSDDYVYKKIGLFASLKESITKIHTINTSTLKALGQIIIGKRGFDDMSGPIKIAKYSGDAMKNGIGTMIYFMALISASLGLMNLLPIPVLDGGHLLFYLIEAIRRKPLAEKTETALIKVGFSILITLMIFVTIKDILGIF